MIIGADEIAIEGAGIYVHVPFCRRRCPYCDFAVTVKVDIPHQRYAAAVIDELRRRRREVGDREVKTIYFGGGTPSLLAVERLEEILEAAGELFAVDPGAEVTLEANPNQVTQEALDGWRAAGINRLSLGCQSFQDRHLHALRRNHDGHRALEAARLAVEAMEQVSIDLMFGGPSQPMQEWREDLEILSELAGECGLGHLSAYNLTIEPGTTFAIRARQKIIAPASDELAAAMMEELVEAARLAGLERYEVSNFAVPGQESEHNSAYWRGRPYLGVGVGAHSLEVGASGGAVRRANPRSFRDYMERREEAARQEELSPAVHLGERLVVGSRTRFGVRLGHLKEQFTGVSNTQRWRRIGDALTRLCELGLMGESEEQWFQPTPRGMDFADSLAAELYQAATERG